MKMQIVVNAHPELAKVFAQNNLGHVSEFEIPQQDWRQMFAEAERQHREDSYEQLFLRVCYRWAAAKLKKEAVKEAAPLSAREFRWWAGVGLTLLLLQLALSTGAHAQVDGLEIQNSGGARVKMWAGGIAKVRCGANLTCTSNSGVVTMAAGAGGTVNWSSILDPAATLALNMNSNTTAFTWAAYSGATDLFAMQDTTGSSSTNYIFRVNSVGTSTMRPFAAFAQGTTNGVEVTSAGLLQKAGAGGISATHLQGRSFSAAAPSEGQIPIWNSGTTTWVPGDPIVSGPAAEGAAPANNPVWVAGRGTDGNVHTPTMFDSDSGAGTQFTQGVSLRKSASGGSVELGTATDPLRTDPTGTTTQPVGGNVASDAVDSGNPVKIGGRAETTAITRVADGDRVDATFDTDGVQFVRMDHPQRWSYHENSSSALTDTTVLAAPGAGVCVFVQTVVASTGAATAWNMFLEEGTTTTVLGPWYLEAVAGRGFAFNFVPPRKLTANTSLTVTTSAAIAHSIDITGFTASC